MPDRRKVTRAVQPTLDELISLTTAVEIGGLTPGRWRQLCSAGVIWGIKKGRDWYTTRQAVREYLARDRRRGPKPKSP